MPEMGHKTGSVARTAETRRLIRMNGECQSMPTNAKWAGFESLRLRHSSLQYMCVGLKNAGACWPAGSCSDLVAPFAFPIMVAREQRHGPSG